MGEEVLDFPSPTSWPPIPSLSDSLPRISSPLTLHLSLVHLHFPPTPAPSRLGRAMGMPMSRTMGSCLLSPISGW